MKLKLKVINYPELCIPEMLEYADKALRIEALLDN
jgi:hypothetical protein